MKAEVERRQNHVEEESLEKSHKCAEEEKSLEEINLGGWSANRKFFSFNF